MNTEFYLLNFNLRYWRVFDVRNSPCKNCITAVKFPGVSICGANSLMIYYDATSLHALWHELALCGSVLCHTQVCVLSPRIFARLSDLFWVPVQQAAAGDGNWYSVSYNYHRAHCRTNPLD